MKANKRVRDLGRRSATKLVYLKDGSLRATTTMPAKGNAVLRFQR